jgi:pilus assembly protein Flp/PilA
MTGFFARFLKDQSGATAVEYGLIITLIAAAVIGGAGSIGTAVNHTLQNATNGLTPAGS